MSFALAANPPLPLSSGLLDLLGWRRGTQPYVEQYQAAQPEIIDVEATLVTEAEPVAKLTAEDLLAARAAQPPIGYSPTRNRAPRMVYAASTPGRLINISA